MLFRKYKIYFGVTWKSVKTVPENAGPIIYLREFSGSAHRTCMVKNSLNQAALASCLIKMKTWTLVIQIKYMVALLLL